MDMRKYNALLLDSSHNSYVFTIFCEKALRQISKQEYSNPFKFQVWPVQSTGRESTVPFCEAVKGDCNWQSNTRIEYSMWVSEQ